MSSVLLLLLIRASLCLRRSNWYGLESTEETLRRLPHLCEAWNIHSIHPQVGKLGGPWVLSESILQGRQEFLYKALEGRSRSVEGGYVNGGGTNQMYRSYMASGGRGPHVDTTCHCQCEVPVTTSHCTATISSAVTAQGESGGGGSCIIAVTSAVTAQGESGGGRSCSIAVIQPWKSWPRPLIKQCIGDRIEISAIAVYEAEVKDRSTGKPIRAPEVKVCSTGKPIPAPKSTSIASATVRPATAQPPIPAPKSTSIASATVNTTSIASETVNITAQHNPTIGISGGSFGDSCGDSCGTPSALPHTYRSFEKCDSRQVALEQLIARSHNLSFTVR